MENSIPYVWVVSIMFMKECLGNDCQSCGCQMTVTSSLSISQKLAKILTSKTWILFKSLLTIIIICLCMISLFSKWELLTINSNQLCWYLQKLTNMNIEWQNGQFWSVWDFFDCWVKNIINIELLIISKSPKGKTGTLWIVKVNPWPQNAVLGF